MLENLHSKKFTLKCSTYRSEMGWVVHLKKSLPKNGLQARKEKGFTVFGTPKKHQGKSIGPQKSWTSRRERRDDYSRGMFALRQAFWTSSGQREA